MYEIVFIMGKSSSGKDSIYKKLKEDDKLGLTYIQQDPEEMAKQMVWNIIL